MADRGVVRAKDFQTPTFHCRGRSSFPWVVRILFNSSAVTLTSKTNSIRVAFRHKSQTDVHTTHGISQTAATIGWNGWRRISAPGPHSRCAYARKTQHAICTLFLKLLAILQAVTITLARQVAQGCVVKRLRAHCALIRSNVLQQTPAMTGTSNSAEMTMMMMIHRRCRRRLVRLHLIPHNVLT